MCIRDRLCGELLHVGAGLEVLGGGLAEDLAALVQTLGDADVDRHAHDVASGVLHGGSHLINHRALGIDDAKGLSLIHI